MSRKIIGRHEYRISLVAEAPILVGDTALAHNIKGQLCLNWKIVKMAVRRHLEARFQNDAKQQDKVIEDYFDIPKGADSLCISDALITQPPTLGPEMRNIVGLGRFTGGEAGEIKCDSDLLPIGSTLDFQMSFKPTSDEHSNTMTGIIEEVLAAFGMGWIHLGHGRARGCGRVKLTAVKRRELSPESGPGTVRELGRRLIGGDPNGDRWEHIATDGIADRMIRQNGCEDENVAKLPDRALPDLDSLFSDTRMRALQRSSEEEGGA